MRIILPRASHVHTVRRSLWARRLIMTLVIIAGLLTAATPAMANEGALHQAQVAIPVHVDGDPATYHIRGELGWRGELPDRSEAVQVLLAGLSYDHNYWDMPYHRSRYSYVSAATAVSTTFNFDQLGTSAAADHPPMQELSLVEQAKVADQVVLALRAGMWVRSGHHRFWYQARYVIVTGHSLGGATALVLASLFPNHIDGVIDTDYLHTANQAGVNEASAVRVPANQTAKYANAAWAANSVTTADGQRSVFYYLPGADAGIILRDELLKAVSSTATAAQAQYVRTNPSLTASMTVPLLAAVGQYDSLNCNADPSAHDPALNCSNAAAVVQREKKFYPGVPCISGYVEPNAGHDMNLHRNAPLWFAAANRWVTWLTDQMRTNQSHRPVRC